MLLCRSTPPPLSPCLDPIELSIFASRIKAVCDEMGGVLKRTAFSTNIKDRLDYSCAVFDAHGALCAQAAHIPVHLGSMAYAMRSLVECHNWQPGEMLIVNDPFLGGTHLPDITVVAAVFDEARLAGFVANRAHHADIGSDSPGSMPLASRIEDEGMILPPALLVDSDGHSTPLLGEILARTRNPVESGGDFAAQVNANRTGVTRLGALIRELGLSGFTRTLAALNDYAERLALSALAAIPDGRYRFCDWLDDDGRDQGDLPIVVELHLRQGQVVVDFSGTAPQTDGNLNCPLPVTAAAVYYVFRCLMPPQTPACAGSLRPVTLLAPAGTLVNAQAPAAVAAGNVETSSRIADAVLGALAKAIPARIPAASQGSMNNVAMGSHGTRQPWNYYETIGGGMGAHAAGPGLDAVQTHMTNTLNTPIEVLELRYPMRVRRYAIRRGSGGQGLHAGGDGLLREFEALDDTDVTLITERRRRSPGDWKAADPANRDATC